jgi:hypothetical protein
MGLCPSIRVRPMRSLLRWWQRRLSGLPSFRLRLPSCERSWGRTAGTHRRRPRRTRRLSSPRPDHCAARVGESRGDVMPEALDEIKARRPMPLAKACADDTLVALAMNGDVLPADHGFPARLVVSGWLGAASIKWLGRIEVSEDPLYVPWNTEDYVLIGPNYPANEPARGQAITALTVASLVELPRASTATAATTDDPRTSLRGREPGRDRPVPHRRRPLAGRAHRVTANPGGVGALAVPLESRTRRTHPPGTRHR